MAFHSTYPHFLRSIGLLILIGGGSLWGQNKWQLKADRLFQEKEYTKAIEYYEWAARQGESPDIWLGMGKSYRALRDFSQAAECFLKATDSPQAPPQASFLLAQCLMSIEQPDSASFWFRQYGSQVGTDATQFSESALDNVISATPFDTSEFEFFKVPVNSKYSDFSPVLVGSDLFFCSNRPTETGVVRTASGDGSYLVDIFWVEGFMDAEKRQRRPRPYAPLNTRFNEGPLCFSGDGETVYLTQNLPPQGKFRQNTLSRLKISIFQKKEEDKWWPGPNIPLNSPDYAIAHPSIVDQGGKTILYFASDKPGGLGGSDIYAVEILAGGDWGVPQNLGPNVNTPGDELFPFVHSDGDLYFSSDGRIGFGGLDILRSSPAADGWSPAQLLEQPINSPGDDFGYRIDSLGENGFFCSNRGNAPSNDDIYGFRMMRPRFEECQPQVEPNYCYRFTEEAIFEENDTVAITYMWEMGDGTKKQGLTVEHCFEDPGQYLVELSLMDTINNLRLLTQASYQLEVKAPEQLYIWAPDQIRVGTSVEIHARESNFPECPPGEFFWEVDGRQKGKGESVQMEFDEPGTYEVRLGAMGAEEKTCKSCVTRKVIVE